MKNIITKNNNFYCVIKTSNTDDKTVYIYK